MIKLILSVLIFWVVLVLLSNPAFAQMDEHIVRLEKLLQTNLDDKKKIDVLIDLSGNYNFSDKLKAEKYANQALELSKEIKFAQGIAYSQYALARVFSDFEMVMAEKFIIPSMKYAQENDDKALLAGLYNLLGKIKARIKSYDEANKYFNQALSYYLITRKDSLMASIYNNIGMNYAYTNEMEKAFVYYQKAALINQKYNNYLWLNINHLNIGGIYLVEEKYDSALKYFNMSLDTALKYNLERNLPLIQGNYTAMYIKNGDYPNARRHAEKALQAAYKVKDYYILKSTVMNLIEMYTDLNQKDSIIHYYNQLVQVKDTIYKNEKLDGIHMLELKYKFEEEQRVSLLKQRKRQVFVGFIISGLMALLGVTLALFLFQRLRVRKKQLENEKLNQEKLLLVNEINLKSRDITYKILLITNMNELISKVLKKLSYFDFKPGKGQETDYQDLISELKLHHNVDIWESFEKEFSLINPDFLNRLILDFPDLTQTEKRLCAFLKLNMSNKEIANIMHIHHESVIKARTRLRKKMNTANPEETLDAILSRY